MEKFILEKDIHLFCIKASSFPDGIKAAHEKLNVITKSDTDRTYFGLSYLYDDKILYMAAAALKNKNETVPTHCETYTLKKGTYISTMVADYLNNPENIKNAFKQLLDDPRIDPNDVRCMVRLAD